MPRNFDAELPEDLSFVAGGETFTMQLVGGDILAEFEDAPDAETAEESIERMYERMEAYLVPGDIERWRKLREQNRLPFRLLRELSTWALEVQTGRPTTQPSRSDSGPGGTAATSSGASRAAAARQAAKARGRSK